jgi:hypothetical protein
LNVKHIVVGILVLSVPSHVVAQSCPKVAGWVETVMVADPPRPMEAKLDTGAETSALSATAFSTFERDGATFVRFTPAGDPAAQPQAQMEARLVRWANVRRAGTKTDRRPVVALPLCIDGMSLLAEFTLADRTGLDYPVLIGRAALAGRIAVDASRTHLATAVCPR